MKEMSDIEFDNIHRVGKMLKEIFHRDGYTKADGMEDYIVRSVEEAKRKTWDVPEPCVCCSANSKWFKFCPDCGRFLAPTTGKPR